MYLARTVANSIYQYSIRQSFMDEKSNNYTYRTLFDLGTNPSSFVHLIDEEFCFFSSELEKKLSQFTEKDPSYLLEKLLWDFIPFEARQRLSYFRGREKRSIRPFTSEDKKQVGQHVDIFDKRRLCYIRHGGVDHTRIQRMPLKFYRPLLGRCRDEKEFFFTRQERDLKPTEYKSYIFNIFNLQQFFSHSYSSFMPEALDQKEIADHFIDCLCALNNNQTFWRSNPVSTSLNQHLIRYVIMFFDYDFKEGSKENDYVRQFMNNHRRFRWPDHKKKIHDDQTQALFGSTILELKKLNRTDFIRLFRKKAKELHPDKGGDHDQFVLLVEIYNRLLKKQ